MCTKARLVQAGKTSEWFGMPMGDGPSPAVDFKLVPNQSAYLEVSIDPAAHGEAGIGPIQRGVSLLTATGQGLQFQLSGIIVRG